MDASSPYVQDHYPDDYAHCFGCGRSSPTGHRLKTRWGNGEGISRYTPGPDQLSVPGFVYGGLVASLVDCHAMATAAADAEARGGRAIGEAPAPRFVTASLEVDFLKPTPIGVELVVRGRVREAGERKAIVEVTVEAAGVVTARGEVVAVRIPDSMRRG
jgi:acyl-coenzyme A thioesterase PaaI-like protein